MIEDGITPAGDGPFRGPPPLPDLPRPDPAAEVLPPTPVALWTALGGRAVVAALTADALWLQDTWELRQVPLQTLDAVEVRRGGTELVLALGPEPSAERLRLRFADSAQARAWYWELQTRQGSAAGPTPDRPVPEGVALVAWAPDVPHTVVGPVGFTGRDARTAERGLQLRAGIRGADAVIGLKSHRCPELGWGARHASGLAVRAEDATARLRLRQSWYAEEVGGLARNVLVLLFAQAVLVLLAGVFCSAAVLVNGPTGETPAEALRSVGVGLALVYAWPLVLLALLAVFRWPQLLRVVGLATLAATTVRGLVLLLAHGLAVLAAGPPRTGMALVLLIDPVDWAFLIAGAWVCVRAWRLADDAPRILPRELQAVGPARKAWAGALLTLTAVYAVVVLGVSGSERYRMSAYLLRPGIDPWREQQALLAYRRGVARLEAHDPAGAEQSFAEAVRLYEELAEGRSRPGPYRAGLALALYGRGYVRWEQGRRDEARADFARVAALGDELAGGPEAGGEVTRVVADARRLVADDEGRQLEEKARLAERKCEEAQVKEDQAPAEAEGLYREAIALWEEVLPRATSAEYRKATVVRLAVAHLNVALQQERQRKFREAEAAARQSVAQGERAVAQEPDRPLPRHNLDLARQTLDRLRQEALQEEIDRLCAVGRFADAADASQRGIDEEEERFRSGKDREAARRALAYRLDHFAWFLAHCADGRVRDPKAAVRHARRATELQPDVVGYWYTLARAQYRNGDWKDSLASLEHLKNAEGGFDALGWLLTALDRQQLGQKDEARDALRKGVERIEEMRRKAEDDARLRWQYERMRPSFESQRREAEQLIEGKGPADTKVG